MSDEAETGGAPRARGRRPHLAAGTKIQRASDILKLEPGARVRLIKSMTPLECSQLYHDWAFWARSDQAPPPGDWIIWLILAGRGAGKTRAGAEAVRHWVETYPIVNLIGATFADVRDTMITGESGILACCRPDERPRFFAADLRLEWPNGAVSWLFSAEEPDRLRGKQHMKLWCDELAAWREPDAFDQALLGLNSETSRRRSSPPRRARPRSSSRSLPTGTPSSPAARPSTTGPTWRGRSSNASPRATRGGRSAARS